MTQTKLENEPLPKTRQLAGHSVCTDHYFPSQWSKWTRTPTPKGRPWDDLSCSISCLIPSLSKPVLWAVWPEWQSAFTILHFHAFNLTHPLLTRDSSSPSSAWQALESWEHANVHVYISREIYLWWEELPWMNSGVTIPWVAPRLSRGLWLASPAGAPWSFPPQASPYSPATSTSSLTDLCTRVITHVIVKFSSHWSLLLLL